MMMLPISLAAMTWRPTLSLSRYSAATLMTGRPEYRGPPARAARFIRFVIHSPSSKASPDISPLCDRTGARNLGAHGLSFRSAWTCANGVFFWEGLSRGVNDSVYDYLGGGHGKMRV